MDLKPILDLSQLAVNVTGIVILGITIWSFRKQMNAQVYLAYTQRYESLMADCDHDFRSPFPSSSSPSTRSTRSGGTRSRSACSRYLNLCSEEYHLMKSGYLAKAVWGIWQGELEQTLRTPLFVSGWPDLEHEFLSHSDFRCYVEQVQRSARTEAA